MTVVAAGSGRPLAQLRGEAPAALRTMAVVGLVGAVCGVLVVGVLSRLAMMLLAALNPSATGVVSDDGFVMGQLTLSGSVNLALVAGPIFGMIGAGCYLALRDLRIGPPWFRALSFTAGPAVVAGSMAVHSTGVDFVLLSPLWLAVALFIALPAIYVAALTAIADRLTAHDPALPTPLLVLGLLAWVPVLPLGLLVVLGWAVRRQGGSLPAARVVPWVARAVLSVVFVAAVLDLARDVQALA